MKTIRDANAAVNYQTQSNVGPVPYPEQGHWRRDDWLRLPDDGWRYEIIDGNLYMDPAPLEPHQYASWELSLRLGAFIKGRSLGRGYTAPIEVSLGDAIVQPDLIFIRADRVSQLVVGGRIVGAPDLVVEIRSPSTWLVDRREKFNLYQGHGVQEYWLVDPHRCEIEIHVLRDSRYELLGKWTLTEEAHSEVLEDFTLKPSEICESSPKG